MSVVSGPGVYHISASDYHADKIAAEPTLSASVAKLIVSRTPLHARHAHPLLNPDLVRGDDEKFDIGNAAHSLMLHDPKNFVIVDAPDWRTKDARERRDAARTAGKIPLLAEQWERVGSMVESAREQLATHAEASGAFTNGKPEQTLIWEEEDGVVCRARLDWLPDGGPFFDDYKTTWCADPDVFQRQIVNLGHDIQAAFYLRGIKALKLRPRPQFRFIVQEIDPPYPLSVIGLAPDFADLADHKVARAIDIWRTCLKTNRWPGYPQRTCWVDAPAWHEAQFIARDVRGHDTDRALREGALAQAPL